MSALPTQDSANRKARDSYREYGADNYVLQFYAEAPSVMGVTDGTLGTWATPATEDTVNTLDILF